ncbi:hypothetical protein [Thermomonospora echinospora]|nr:hypothetical protein [Thermomonospora echinospora]
MGERGPWKRRIVTLVVVWGWMPALAWLLWWVLALLMPGFRINQSYAHLLRRWFFPDGDLTAVTALGWLWVAAGLVVTALAVGWIESEAFDFDAGAAALAWGSAVLAVVVLAWPFTAVLWDNDKDAGRYYSGATVFHVPDLDRPPGSLTDLLRGARPGDGRACDRLGGHDVRSCVKKDTAYSSLRWEARTSSLAAARTAMNNAASPVQRVDVMDMTLTYLWGEADNTGRWSAVLDGSGIRQPMYGVAEWDGVTNTARVCRFAGDYRIDRAFGGSRKNSLRNLLAERYPRLVYDDTDIWGYCENDRPVVVIPVQRQIGYAQRTVQTSGGVLVLRGSAGGRPVVQYRPRARPGELPGPVYSISLVRAQRDATQWSAGREHRNRSSFGFEPSDFETQSENPGEYLLRGSDKRLYYVTPLTPRGSESQALIAYGVAPADQSDSGRLNRYDVYVLADGDPQVASLGTLKAQAVAHISGPSSPYPNFLNSGGALQEFVPLGGDTWRVYGVQNGQTAFYIDLSATGRVRPKTVAPGQDGQEGEDPKVTAPSGEEKDRREGCGRSVREMTDRQLTECLGELADELRRRSTTGG